MKRLLVYLFIVLGLVLTFNAKADNHSKDLKKINEQLISIKKLLDTGVLDADSYKQSKNRLDKRKKILLAKNKKKNESSQKISQTLDKQIKVLENLLKDGVLSEDEFLKTKKYLIKKENDGNNRPSSARSRRACGTRAQRSRW